MKRSSGISSRLGEAILRRRRIPLDVATANVQGGGVVELAEEDLPLSEILSRSRSVGRAARGGEYLHVSDLVGRCIRKVAIIETLGMPAKAQSLTLTDSLTYAQGDAIHDVIKSRVAGGAPEMTWGNWACRCGTTKTDVPCLLSEVGADRKCHACGSLLTNYVEVPMYDEELKIVGTPDLLTYLPSVAALYISELKSVAHDRWQTLVRPDPDHVIQALFYWFLMNRNSYRIANRVSVVYITKGWLFSGNPWKEFTFDAQAAIARLDPYLADARAILEARRGGALPERPCSSPQAAQAKKCEVCRTCFGAETKPVEVSIIDALRGSLKVEKDAA